MRWWDGITNSMDMRSASCKLWELVTAGKPGPLQSLGMYKVGHNWAAELSWAELSTCVLRAGVRKAAATEQGPCGISLLCFTLQSTQSCMKIHYKACLSEGKSELSVTSRGFSSLSPHLIWATWESNFGGYCPFNRHPSKASSDNHFQFSSARSHYSSFLKILFLLFQVEI